MVYKYRVEKRRSSTNTTTKRGRGRPPAWSNSWRKRLLVLRLCGLSVEVIVDLLNLLNQGSFHAKERRAQQILAGILSEGYQRYCPRDKTEAAERIRFFRSIRGQYRKKKLSNTKPLASWGTRDNAAAASAIICTTFPPSTSDDASVSESATSNARAEAPRSTRVDDSIKSCLPGSSMHSSSDEAVTILSSDRKSIASSVRSFSKIKDILRRNSYNSSLASGIASLLRQRFSASTFETYSDHSQFGASIFEKEAAYSGGCFADRAERTLQVHMDKCKMLNAEVIAQCCALTSSCIHRDLHAMAVGGIPIGALARFALSLESLPNTAFFAAMSGAPADAILACISMGIRYVVNTGGQDFLFFLDPAGFRDGVCTCPRRRHPIGSCRCCQNVVPHNPHHSKFECLIRRLEMISFNFERIDHNRRSFLSFLCSKPDFDLEWMLHMMRKSPEWHQRVRKLSQLRDSSGCFIIDYLALSLHYSKWAESTLSVFRPQYKDGGGVQRVLVGEFSEGETALHKALDDHRFAHDVLPLYLQHENYQSDLNKYDHAGRTPLMRYLDRAVKNNISERSIIISVRSLIEWGANVNARSRGGSTILHFAAKKGLPELIKTLLAYGAQPDHVDERGFHALDYAAKLFGRSRSWKSSPELTATSLKVSSAILAFNSSTKGELKSFWEDMAVRSSASVSVLRDH